MTLTAGYDSTVGSIEDAVVIGVGGVGSAVLYHLALRGVDALGIEAHQVGHDRTASAGGTRAFRMAYPPGSALAALAARAETLWHDLAARADEPLFDQRGALLVAPVDDPMIARMQASCDVLDLELDVFDNSSLRRRFPCFLPADDDVGLLERRGGLLHASACDAAHRRLAGARVRAGVVAQSIEPERDHLRIITTEGDIAANSVIVTAGAWLARVRLFAQRLPIVAKRQVQLWHRPAEPQQFADLCAYNFSIRGDEHSYYGTGVVDERGVLIGRHGDGPAADADVDRHAISAAELAQLSGALRARLPSALGVRSDARVGLYATTPDGLPIVGAHPACRRLLIGGGLCGYGYKIVSALGETLAQLSLDGGSGIDVSAFSPARFVTADLDRA